MNVFTCSQIVARCTSVISVARFVLQQVFLGNTSDFIQMKGRTNVLYVMGHLKTRPILRGMVLNTPESRSSNVICVTSYFLINVSITKKKYLRFCATFLCAKRTWRLEIVTRTLYTVRIYLKDVYLYILQAHLLWPLH